AGDADEPARPLRLPGPQRAELAVETVLRLLADRAGIDHQQVGVVLLLRAGVARVVEQVRDLLRVVDVHLAAVRADAEARRGGVGVSAGVHGGEPYRSASEPGNRPPAASPGLIGWMHSCVSSIRFSTRFVSRNDSGSRIAMALQDSRNSV